MTAAATIGARISGVGRAIPSWVVYLLGIVPGAWVFWQAVNGAYIEPVEKIEHEFGRLALQFLLASLTITPLMRFARINLVKFRKVFGLLAFGYVAAHFLVWLLLDLQLRWGQIAGDIAKRPYITVGFLAFLLLIPLAATSWQGAIRRLGAVAWGRLHRLVYVVALLGVVHFAMQERVWSLELILYIAASVVLLGLRFTWIRRW
ncbi:protein-methionine-sulfoxide reductase heme-binding subunit MsrQ [Jannaschia marina]|uniref:sulfite oxidase heme-binding subunit YedZ n=1 Tax=Jannaschia marina TaxID=2741674 RepID=UPI0015CAD622|nr:protein-methionine-sulfoxide reductase heme-binding subunit MsrQ [Jannaschia marina]